MKHELKIATEYFEAIERGDKLFEVRKDDRGGYQVDDYLWLRECEYKKLPASSFIEKIVNFITRKPTWISVYTGKSMLVRVTYLLKGRPYVPNGYVIMGITPVQCGCNPYQLLHKKLLGAQQLVAASEEDAEFFEFRKEAMHNQALDEAYIVHERKYTRILYDISAELIDELIDEMLLEANTNHHLLFSLQEAFRKSDLVTFFEHYIGLEIEGNTTRGHFEYESDLQFYIAEQLVKQVAKYFGMSEE